MKKKFMTTGELARLSQLSPPTIFRAIASKKIKVATTPGGHYRIPMDEAQRFLQENNFKMPSSLALQTILVVEDNPVELRFFKRALGHVSDWTVHATESGYEAGFLTLSLKPDLIVLDILLKDGDGRDIAALVRKNPDLKQTKLLAVSGAKKGKDLKEILAFGFDAVLFKPVKPDKLLEKVNELLS